MKNFSLVLLLSLLAGCGARPLVADGEAHTVVLRATGCNVFVVRTLHRGFAVLEGRAPAAVPALGDLLEGPPLRRGPQALAAVPAAADHARSGRVEVVVEVRGHGLPLAEAQARWAAACG